LGTWFTWPILAHTGCGQLVVRLQKNQKLRKCLANPTESAMKTHETLVVTAMPFLLRRA
jgi:hypothetical protein